LVDKANIDISSKSSQKDIGAGSNERATSKS